MKIIVLSWLILLLHICRPTPGLSSTNTAHCFHSERDALLQFKHGISNDECELLASWERDTDCCHWLGVHCSNQTGHVIALDFPSVNPDDFACLEGKVSPSLGELMYLKVLNLSFNDFDGEIPHQLGNLSKLTTLDLSFSYYNTNTTMKSLDWISRLRLLRYLDLSSADLSKVTNWMAVVNNLRFLNVLLMKDCHLPAKIPSSLIYTNSSATPHSISLSGNNFNDTSIFRWLFNLPGISTRLVHLDLSSNAFQGSIPSEFWNFLSLSYLDLSDSKLQGLIPSEFGKMHSLSYLDLSQNMFQGSVFKIIRKLCNLKRLYLSANNFTDELTNVIQAVVSCENKGLITLDLSRNKFSGPIPGSINSFSLLKELFLNENQLNGKISDGIGQLSALEKLDISFNSLEGTLTHTHFLTLSRLRELDLSGNKGLVINLDANWIPPFQLDFIGLRSCKLGPYFPTWLRTQTNFTFLDVSNANISDNIPISFLDSSNLKYLNMSYNQFYGMVPNLSEESGLVYVVDLSSNLFEGIVPFGFTMVQFLYLNDNRFSDASYILCPKTVSFVQDLDLSNNLFSGALPDCWMILDQVSSLHLENNRFSGNIPKSMGTMVSLNYLHLHNNRFSEPIPASFENLTSLIILSVGYNSLSGYIPPWIGNLQTVGALILRRNHFIGEIPVSVCQLAHL